MEEQVLCHRNTCLGRERMSGVAWYGMEKLPPIPMPLDSPLRSKLKY